MRNLILGAIAGTALWGAAAITPAQASVSADINIHLGRRAPSVYFVREPRVMLIPETEVYYVNDYDDLGYDMYRCDDWWYINDGGNWYRSQYYRGPWVNISISTLPRRVLNVPISYRHQPYRSQGWDRGYDGRYQQSRGTWSGRQSDDRSWSDRSRRSHDRNWSGSRQSNDRDRDVRWRDGRNHDDRDDRDWNNDRRNGNGHGKGKGHGKGNGKGRGHGNR